MSSKKKMDEDCVYYHFDRKIHFKMHVEKSEIVVNFVLVQVRSQDRSWGGAGPSKVDFLNLTPLTLLQKPHFWVTLWLKVDLLADLGWCITPPGCRHVLVTMKLKVVALVYWYFSLGAVLLQENITYCKWVY